MTKAKSPLIAAATDLDEQLSAFDDKVGAFKKLALTSKKNLDRGAKMLEELAVSEQAMGTQISALVQAIAAAREQQQARVAAVREQGEALKARSVELRDLLVQFEALGSGAAALNEKLQGPAPAVVDVADELKALGDKAEGLFLQAREKQFDDVAHLADGLKQQLTSLANKLSGAADARAAGRA